MAGIKDAMKDVLAKLASVEVTNNDNTSATPYVRVWNNQLRLDEKGEIESFPKPAFFLEVVSPAQYEIMGQGFRNADINWRIHIIHEYYNDTSGVTYEQDLPVFDLRDNLLVLLTYFTPAGCGAMACISEQQDFDHKNLYHLILDFVNNFTDSKGSRLDPGRDYFTDSVPPTALDIQTTEVKTGLNVIENQQPFILP